MKAAILVVIGCILLVAFSCSNEGGGFFAKLLKGGGAAVPVTVESVVLQERAQDLKVLAVIEPSDPVEITFPDDATVEKIFVSQGSMVGVGDPLVKISDLDLQAKLARQRGELKDTKTTAEKNQYLLKNRDRLLEEGKIDKYQYDNLEADAQTSDTAVEKIGQTITKIEERLLNTTVSSPITGMVGKINVTQGSQTSSGKALMTISKADPLGVSFKLSSTNAKAVRPGMLVTLRFPDLQGESAQAKLTYIGTELDPTTNTFPVKGLLPNPTAQYKSGMNAEVIFTSPDKQRFFIIPEEALIKERQAYFVYTVSKGIAHRVQVIPNDTIGNRVEIARGLNEEDIVVVKGHDKLTEGTVVDIWGR